MMYKEINNIKGKSKFHIKRGHEGTEGDKMYSCTLSLTSALDKVGGQRNARPLYSRERDQIRIV